MLYEVITGIGLREVEEPPLVAALGHVDVDRAAPVHGEVLAQFVDVVRLETRPPNIEARGEVTQRDLLRNCLRMRPDRIIIGEVRGAEALDMLQAMRNNFV